MRAPQEDIDVARLVLHLRRKEHRDADVFRMQPRHEPRRDVERGQLVLREKAHHLPDRQLERRLVFLHRLPRDVAGRAPLRSHRLLVELRHVGRHHAIALHEIEGIHRPACFDGRAMRRESGRRVRPFHHRSVRHLPSHHTELSSANQMTRFGIRAEIFMPFGATPRRELFRCGWIRRKHGEHAARLEKRECRPDERQKTAANRETAAVDGDCSRAVRPGRR
jgi:hypothetical protein